MSCRRALLCLDGQQEAGQELQSAAGGEGAHTGLPPEGRRW